MVQVLLFGTSTEMAAIISFFIPFLSEDLGKDLAHLNRRSLPSCFAFLF